MKPSKSRQVIQTRASRNAGRDAITFQISVTGPKPLTARQVKNAILDRIDGRPLDRHFSVRLISWTRKGTRRRPSDEEDAWLKLGRVIRAALLR